MNIKDIVYSNVGKVVYNKHSYEKYKIITFEKNKYLVGIGAPYIEKEYIYNANLLSDIIMTCNKMKFDLNSFNGMGEYDYNDANECCKFFFENPPQSDTEFPIKSMTEEDEELLIELCNKYGFPLISHCDLYIGESPAYLLSSVYEEMRILTLAMAAKNYIIKENTLDTKFIDVFSNIKRDDATQKATIQIIDYISSAHFTLLPNFETSFKGDFEYNTFAESVFDIARIHFCQLLNYINFGECKVCHKYFEKKHGNDKYCPLCNNKYNRVSDKNYKSNLRKDPIRNLCKKYMDKKRRELGAESEKYHLIRDEIIKLRKNAISEDWSINELERKLKSIKCS